MTYQLLLCRFCYLIEFLNGLLNCAGVNAVAVGVNQAGSSVCYA